MQQLIQPTNLQIKGPWLLDEESLSNLDDVILEEWKRLESRRLELFEREVEERIQSFRERPQFEDQEPSAEEIKDVTKIARSLVSYQLERSNQNLTLLMKDESSYSTTTFKEAMRDSAMIDAIPVGFTLDIESAEIRGLVRLSNRVGELSIDVSPAENRETQELFMTLRNWAMSYRPPLWQQAWMRIREFHWLLWVLLVIFALQFIGLQSNDISDITFQQVKELVDTGISDDNLHDAVRLLLIYISKYDPMATSSELPNWFKILFFGGMALSFVISILPKTLLAIGRGKVQIDRWRIWLRIMGVTIPALIFGSLIWPYIVTLLRDLF